MASLWLGMSGSIMDVVSTPQTQENRFVTETIHKRKLSFVRQFGNGTDDDGHTSVQSRCNGQSEFLLLLDEKLDSFEQGLPSIDDMAILLHKYTKQKGLKQGLCLHTCICSSGLDTHFLLGNLLVTMLVELGKINSAQQVFNRLAHLDGLSWNSLIIGFVKQNRPEDALILYQALQCEEFVYPDHFAFVALLKACIQMNDIVTGDGIHEAITKRGMESNVYIGSVLINMYFKFGEIEKAEEVFKKIGVRDTVLWNTLITGYVEHGHGTEALRMLEYMQHGGFCPDGVTFICTLKACAITRNMRIGQAIHSQITKMGLSETGLVIGSALIDMYAKCGLLVEARTVFDKLIVRDTVSWSVLMSGYVEYGRFQEALDCFSKMQLEGVFVDNFAFACSLKACWSIGAIEKGKGIHEEIIKQGYETDLIVASSLVEMYARCGLLEKAREVFDKLPVRDTVTWSALIAGYAEHECGEEAIQCFKLMQSQNVSPDVAIFASTLKACSSIRAVDMGIEIHKMVVKMDLEGDTLVGNSLVDMYGKCGLITKAKEAFEKILVRDSVSWNVLILSYVECGQPELALFYLEEMQVTGISPNAITFVSVLKACSVTGCSDMGKEIHSDILMKGLESNYILSGTLVHMYARCGLLIEAEEVFNKLPIRHTVMWNVLLAGYAQIGESECVFNAFNRLIAEGVKPDVVTFLTLVHACTHAGLVDLGLMYFEVMTKEYGLIPSLEHHTSLVDLLGRAGQLASAMAIINKMPYKPDIPLWHTFLYACHRWGDIELGKNAFLQALDLDELDAAAYISMANIFAND